ELALEGIKLMYDAMDLRSPISALDSLTAEVQADQARFDYYVSVCTVYKDTGKPVFADLNDYIKRSEEDVAQKAADKLAQILYGVSEDYTADIEEYKFLKKYNFMN